MSLSEQWDDEHFFATISWFSLSALCLSIFVQMEQDVKDVFLVDTPHVNKTYLSFKEFYPFYLSEHSDSTNRVLHFVGTSLTILGCLFASPRTLASFGFVFPIALCVFYSTIKSPNGFVEFVVLLSLLGLVTKFLTGKVRSAILVGLCGYGFAWFGHFFFELNKPATFTYPTFSLMGDFCMWLELATGRINF